MSTDPQRRGRRRRRPGGEAGFAAVELAVIAPVVIALLLLVVGLGRVSHGHDEVDQAAAAAARAAALTNTPAQAGTAAQDAATATLAQAGLTCTDVGVSVDTGDFFAGGQITATVRCTTSLSGLALAGLPGSITMSAHSVAPLETYRDFSTGAEQ